MTKYFVLLRMKRRLLTETPSDLTTVMLLRALASHKVIIIIILRLLSGAGWVKVGGGGEHSGGVFMFQLEGSLSTKKRFSSKKRGHKVIIGIKCIGLKEKA